MKKIYHLFNALILTFLFSSITIAQITYVNGTASGAGNGTSWTDAFTELQVAIDATSAGDEIWIATGTYTPSNTALDTFNTFQVNAGVSIYGGFAGTETSKEQRVDGENIVILSGDILRNDISNNFTTNKEDNVFHVMTLDAPIENLINLDGITFQGGYTREATSNTDITWRGGAIYSYNTVNITNCNFNNNFARSGAAIFLSPEKNGGKGSIIDNCVVERNSCVTQAAGIYLAEISDVTVSNSIFQNNATNRGALYPLFCTNFLADNCTFRNNISTTNTNFGGAMFIWNSTGTVRDCTFESNSSGNAAAIHINGSEMEQSVPENFTFDNCTFTGNAASDFGGGAVRTSSASFTMKDCEFNGNFAPNGGAIFSGGAGQEIVSFNNTFNGNTADFGASQACYGLYSNYSLLKNTYEENIASISGGGLINGFGANVRIDSCDFLSNIAQFGGAMSNQNDTTNVEIYNSEFIENTAGGGNGGALNIIDPVTMSIDNCLFQMNSADFGGAINGSERDVDVIEGYLHLSNSRFFRNTVSTQGAGISLVNLDLEMTNTVIGTNLSTGTGAGGGLSLNSTANRTMTANITNSTFADNFAFVGAGISAFTEDETSNCIVNLQNTILDNEGLNYQVESGTPTINSMGGNISSDATLMDIFTNTRDQNNVEDLKFVNNSDFDYQIEDESPAINNGVADGAPETDILGNPRVGDPDVGAYENQDPLAIDVIENTDQLSLMPNPAYAYTKVSLTNEWLGNIQITILDISGKVISNSVHKKTSQEFLHDLELNNLNSGNYILSLQSRDKKISASFIKI